MVPPIPNRESSNCDVKASRKVLLAGTSKPFVAKSLKMSLSMNFMAMFCPPPWHSRSAFSMYSVHKEVRVFDMATRSKGLVNAHTGAHKVEPELLSASST